jgi:predicted permease
MDTIAAALERQYPDVNAGIGVRIVPMHEEIVGDVRQPLLILFGSAAFVLLIACANVANLLFARAASRRKELAIRAALGAGRGRLIRQLLMESLVLAAAGGAAGLLLAAWGVQALPSLAPSTLPRLTGVRIDGLVVLYTTLATLVTGLVFGAGPALRDAAGAAAGFLKERGRTASHGSGGRRLRSLVATAEIAVALVLVIGAGLLVRSFIKLNSADLGFDPRSVLAVRVHLPAARYAERAQVAAFYDGLVSRLRALPGVESVGLGSSVQRGNSGGLAVEGRPPLPRNARDLPVAYDTVTADFFKALRIPLLRGRLFSGADGPAAPLSVVVNESFVTRFFPNEDPLGKRVTFGDPSAPTPPWLTIVGVVSDTRRAGLDRAPRAEVYYSHSQATDRRMYALVRTMSDPQALVQSVRAQVWAIDPNQPIYSIRAVDEILADSQADRRFTMLLLGLFSVVALALAAVGIYGVMAYSTAQRVQEFGVRLALGARRTDVLIMVLKEGVAIGAAGLVVGVGAALALTRVMSGLLFGVSERDPVTFVALPLALLIVTVLATLIPAARAVRVDPVVALRGD